MYCGRGIEQGVRLTLDHLAPQSAGKNHKSSNLVTACLSCNSKRKDLPWVDYLRKGWHSEEDVIARVLHIERLRRRKVKLDKARAIIAGRTFTEVLQSIAKPLDKL